MKWYPKKGNKYNLVRYTGRANGWKLSVIYDQGHFFFTASAEGEDKYRSQNFQTITDCQSTAETWAKEH